MGGGGGGNSHSQLSCTIFAEDQRMLTTQSWAPSVEPRLNIDQNSNVQCQTFSSTSHFYQQGQDKNQQIIEQIFARIHFPKKHDVEK